MDKSVIVQLWGKQVVDKKPVNMAAKKGKNTKAIMRAETLKKNVSMTERGDAIFRNLKMSYPSGEHAPVLTDLRSSNRGVSDLFHPIKN